MVSIHFFHRMAMLMKSFMPDKLQSCKFFLFFLDLADGRPDYTQTKSKASQLLTIYLECKIIILLCVDFIISLS